MPLTKEEVQNALPGVKARRLFDGGNLYLEISPRGGKWWRVKYLFGGRDRRLSLGVYPEVSLAEARAKRDEAMSLVRRGIDPGEAKATSKAAAKRLAAAESGPQLTATIALGGEGIFIRKGRGVLELTREEARSLAALLAKVVEG